MQMPNEYFVQKIVWNLHCRNTLMGTTANIEKEFISIAQLNKKAGSCLLGPGAWHSRTAGGDPHLLG